MQNFNFYNPTRIIFGENAISELQNFISKKYKILMIYGKGSIKENGIYDQVKLALKDYNLLEFGGVEANPSYETLMKAVTIVKKEKIDFLLAVGGGSVIDGTKFISAASLFDGNAWDILSKKVEIKKAISFATVLTLPASGSEMNNGAVISRKESHEKLVFSNELVYPQFSILDPSVCTSLPKEQIANGIIDAFVHVIEQYLTFPVNSPLQDRFAESILNTLIEEGPKLFANSSDYESAGNIMWCATMALNGLIVCGVPEDWSTHMIGHELTSLTGIDHAQTLAIVLPGVLSVMKENKKIKLLQYAEKVWNIDEVDESKKINLAIEKTEKFFHFFNVKTKLSDYKVSLGVIDEIVARFEKRQLKLGERSDITSDKVREILRVRL